MRLQVTQALVGTPQDGDDVEVVLADGRTIEFGYKPHSCFSQYVWWLQGASELPEVQTAFSILKRRGIDSRFAICYLEFNGVIAMDHDLDLVLVPRGNMHDWPRFTLNSRVASIRIF